MNKQIECLQRMMVLNGSLDDVVDFLIEENLLDASELVYYKRDVNKPKYIWNLLNEARQKDKVMLFDFEWQVLPVERIRITVVTNGTTRFFTCNYA